MCKPCCTRHPSTTTLTSLCFAPVRRAVPATARPVPTSSSLTRATMMSMSRTARAEDARPRRYPESIWSLAPNWKKPFHWIEERSIINGKRAAARNQTAAQTSRKKTQDENPRGAQAPQETRLKRIANRRSANPGGARHELAKEIFSMAYETLLYEVADEIATITLNRPAKMNAYTAEMGREIAEAMLQADRDRSARVVIMTGAGERAFCAGADMSMFASNIKTREQHGSVDEGRGGGISLPVVS